MKNSKLKFHSALVADKNPHETRAIEAAFKMGEDYLQCLVNKLNKMLDTKIKESEGINQYLNMNWAQYQADNRGYRRAVRDILSLIEETN